MNIAICDDDAFICSQLEQYLVDYWWGRMPLEIELWQSGTLLTKKLREGYRPDLIFLDIELGEWKGYQIGELVREVLGLDWIHIIYISNHATYAMELFRTRPLDFLIKPITPGQVGNVLNKSLGLMDKEKKVFRYQAGKRMYQVPCHFILYFYSEGKKVYIVSKEGETRFYGKLADIKINLPDNFAFIHKSFLININKIRELAYERVVMMNGRELNISKACRKTFRQYMLWAREAGKHDRSHG